MLDNFVGTFRFLTNRAANKHNCYVQQSVTPQMLRCVCGLNTGISKICHAMKGVQVEINRQKLFRLIFIPVFFPTFPG
jgi:hypothetical protein